MVAAWSLNLSPRVLVFANFAAGSPLSPVRTQVRCWQHEEHTMLMPSIRCTLKLRVHHCTGIIAQMPHAGRQEPTRYRSCCSVPARAPHINGRGVEEACWQRSGEGAAVARSGCLSTSTDKGERPREGQELVVYLDYHYLLIIRCDSQTCRISALREAGNRLLCRDQLAFIHPMPMCADLRVHASMSNTRQTCLPPSRTPKTPRYSTNAVSAKSHNPQECPCQRSIMRICQEAQLMKASTYVVNRPPCP